MRRLTRLVPIIAMALGACAGLPEQEMRAPVAGPSRHDVSGRLPVETRYAGDAIHFRYESGGQSLELVARWLPLDGRHLGHAFRAARVEAGGWADPAATTGVPVEIEGAEAWQALVVRLLSDLAPEAPDRAALVEAQGVAAGLVRQPDGSVRIVPPERLPSAAPTVVSDEALARHANDLLAREKRGPVLFVTGGDQAPLVFVDAARQLSVFIALPPQVPGPLLGRQLELAVRALSAVVLKSHLLTLAQSPIATTTRLGWLALSTGMSLLPRPVPVRAVPPLAAGPAMDLKAWEARLDALVRAPRTRGTFRPLPGGQRFFPVLVEALESARHSIDLQVYIFDNDPVAVAIADLLKRRSREVPVRVLADELGSLGAGGESLLAEAYSLQPGAAAASIEPYLRADSEVEVRFTANPWLTGDHTKLIVIDRQRGFVGGMNIGREYRYDWHDLMVEVTGPVVGALVERFEGAWLRAAVGADLAALEGVTRALAGSRSALPAAADDAAMVDLRLLETRPGEPEILVAQRAAIRAARQSIVLEQPYLTDDEIVAELIAARRRGVDVRVILPSRADFGFMTGSNLLTANLFVENGIRVWLYPGLTHAKAAIYDGWALVGSANLDKLSLHVNRELDIATSDRRAVSRLQAELFDPDFARSREMTEPRPVGWGAYLAEFIADQL